MILRLYCDEDSSDTDVLRGLRARGVDIVTAVEVGNLQWPDDQQLAYAAAGGRVLFTYNLGDFLRLHRACLSRGQSHAGIIVARQQRYAIGEVLRRLLRIVAARSAEDMRNHVEFLSAWGRDPREA